MAERYANANGIPFKDKEKLEAIQLIPTVIEEIGEEVIGKQIQLHAKVLLHTTRNPQLVYQSNDEEIVAVDETGLVTIKGYGDTQITVMTADGTKSAQCDVHIRKDDKPNISNIAFPGKKTSYSAIYTGEQIRPVMTVFYQYTDDSGKEKTQKLKWNIDYTVRYDNNINAGENTAKVTVRGIGEFTGTITKEFTILPKSISGVTLSMVGDIVYGEEPSVIVTDGNHELTKGRDYNVVLSTSGLADADTASVLTVESEAIVVKDGKRTLMEDAYTIDYGTISEIQDIKIGQKYFVTLTPKAGGNYVDNSKKVVSIKFGQLNLASKTAKVTVQITNAANNKVVVRYNGITLIENKDYIAEVKRNDVQNTYTIIIKAVKGSAYKGRRTIKDLIVGQ